MHRDCQTGAGLGLRGRSCPYGRLTAPLKRPPTEEALLSGRFRFIAPPRPDSQTYHYAKRQSDCSEHHDDGEEPDEVKRVAFIGDELPVPGAAPATIPGEQLARCVPAVQLGEPEP